MKKSFKVYFLIWAICLAVFNVIIFVTPNEIGGVSKFGDSFWVGYIFITLAFIGQLACAFVAFKAENLKKLFYNIPLFSISYGGLIAMLVAGGIFMAVPALSEWIGIIVCVIILAFYAIAVVKAVAAAEIVAGTDERIKAQTFFIKSLIVDAQILMSSAKTDDLRAQAKNVYEELRYSDPMADPALAESEAQLARQFKAFADAVKAEDADLARETAAALLALVQERNQKCKLLK